MCEKSMRDEFELNPEIQPYIASGDVYWSEEGGDYFSSDHEVNSWIGGVWLGYRMSAEALWTERSNNQSAESQLAQANGVFREINDKLKQKISKIEYLIKDVESGYYGDLDDGSSLQSLVFDMKRILK